MCGIAAELRPSPGPVPLGWDACLSRLARRGPDSHGTWRSPDATVTLGHRRLAIQDLTTTGHQPMTTPDGSVAIVFNGEIYNAPALRSELQTRGHHFISTSDTEVLLHAYTQWGRGLFTHLHGMYAFLLWDHQQRAALAAVDHVGMKPLAWSCIDGVLRLASDCDALRALLPQPPALDPTSLCHILSLGYCPAPGSVWQGVNKLPPGHFLTWSPGSAPSLCRHWSPPETHQTTRAEAFGPLWEAVVKEHLLADVPVGLLLSGGLDSSAVAVALSRAKAPVHCTTLALPGVADESAIAAQTAAMLSIPCSRVQLDSADIPKLLTETADAFDEPQAFGAILTMTRVAQAARARNKVVLSGDGGDEAFAGYTWHRLRSSPANAHTTHAALDAKVRTPDADPATRAAALESLASLSYTHAHLKSVFPRFHPAEAAALLNPLGARYDADTYASWLSPHDRPHLTAPRRAQRLDLLGFCPGSILPKVDRAAMGVGLEVRTPFLDRRILDHALAHPVDPRELDAATSKPTIRSLLKGHVPDSVLTRDKQGFSLRLGRSDIFTSMEPWLAQTKLVTTGVLSKHWRAFVAPGVPSSESRMFALCMLAAWAQPRI